MSEGVRSFCGLEMQQHASVAAPFRWLFYIMPPDRILEIGTGGGGFTLMLRHLLPDTPIRSYDILDRTYYSILRQAGVDVRVSADQWEKSDEYIGGPGRTLILCDGGNKIREFCTLAPQLKPGDVIMAHDYARDAETLERQQAAGGWLWCEITESDIAEACRKCNLIDHLAEAFAAVGWCCKQRRAGNQEESLCPPPTNN